MGSFALQVSIGELVRIKVWDDDPVDPDDFLGLVEISIRDELANIDGCTIEKIFYLKDVPKDTKTKEEKRANVTLKVQWVPFDFEYDE